MYACAMFSFEVVGFFWCVLCVCVRDVTTSIHYCSHLKPFEYFLLKSEDICVAWLRPLSL